MELINFIKDKSKINLEKELFEIISEYFSENSINLDKWEEILINTDANPSVYHLLSKVRYYVAILAQNNSINLSIVLHENYEAVGFDASYAHKSLNDKWILSSNGNEIVEPIFKKSLGNKSRKKLQKNFPR